MAFVLCVEDEDVASLHEDDVCVETQQNNSAVKR